MPPAATVEGVEIYDSGIVMASLVQQSYPRPSQTTHVRGEPGAKPFIDDLLLGRGFVRSRSAPSLRSIESQPSTQGVFFFFFLDFPGGSDGKASLYNVGHLGSIPGSEDSLEKEMATHSNTLAQKIPWMEELGAGGTWCRLLSMGSQRVGHD